MNERANDEEKETLSCGRDWAALLPDVLAAIFVKIGSLEVLGAAGCVCRSWRKVAKEQPELWRRIDITNHRYGHDPFVLNDPTRLAIDRSKGRLEEFAIKGLGDYKLLQYLCDRTSILKKLCLIACFRIVEVAIAETAKRQPLLEELNITFGTFKGKVIEIIGRECPQLKTFKFNDIGCSVFPDSPSAEDAEDDYVEAPVDEELSGDEDDEDDYVEVPVDEELTGNEESFGIANTMHQLRHLQLLGKSMTNEGLRAILNGCPHLETLDIRGCHNVNMDADMWALCARLKTMRLPEDSLDNLDM